MGILSAFGGFSRVVGPLMVSYIYTNYGTYLTFGVMAGIQGIGLILTLSMYKRLVPFKIIETRQDEADNDEWITPI